MLNLRHESKDGRPFNEIYLTGENEASHVKTLHLENYFRKIEKKKKIILEKLHLEKKSAFNIETFLVFLLLKIIPSLLRLLHESKPGCGLELLPVENEVFHVEVENYASYLKM